MVDVVYIIYLILDPNPCHDDYHDDEVMMAEVQNYDFTKSKLRLVRQQMAMC